MIVQISHLHLFILTRLEETEVIAVNSQKSSLSLFWLTFRSALKGNFIFPLFNLIVLTILFPVLYRNNVDISIRYITDCYSGKTWLFNGYKYIIFNPERYDINCYAHISIIIVSILLAIALFSFITNKQKINVYFSLGMTRKILFLSKYFPGLFLLFISIALPFIACFILNIHTFGFSPHLMYASLYFVFGFFALAAVCFSAATIVFCCVGNIFEAIAFSGIFLAGPTSVIFCSELLLGKFTLGSPFGLNIARFSSMNFDFSLISLLFKYNPILFLLDGSLKYGSFCNSSKDDIHIWAQPDYRRIVLWLLVTILFLILGMVLFQKRKVEISGTVGANRFLNSSVTFLLCFLPFCLSVAYINPQNLGIIIGIAAVVFVYLITDFSLKLNIRKWRNGLFKLPLYIGVTLLIFLVFACGLFGFSSKIPKIEDIKTADISPVTYTGLVNQYNMNFYGGLDDSVFSVGMDEPLKGFKSKKDLETITSIHRFIIKTGKVESKDYDYVNNEKITANTSIKLLYHLKNGKTIYRYYKMATPEIFNAMLSIDTTNRYKEIITQKFYKGNAYKENSYGIFAISKKLNSETKLSLSSLERTQLFDALTEDLTQQTITERYYPKEPAIGAILLSFYNGYIVTDSDSWIDLSMHGCPCVVITNDMVNTIRFLKSKGYMKFFNNSTEFVAAQIIDASTTIIDKAYFYSDQVTNHFMGGWNKKYYKLGYFENSYKITDTSLLKEIVRNAHISYFNNVPGYYVKFELSAKGGYTVMYIPANKMPQSVINGVAAIAIK